MATVEQIESYISSLEEFLSSSLTSVAPDLPHLNEIVHRIWADITRFGPPALPQLPGLGSFEIPPSTPLPPPPPPTWTEKLAGWAGEHKWAAASAGIGFVGAGLLAGYNVVKYRQSCAAGVKRKDSVNERREVVVVLGADHPIGTHLVLGLEAQGYIVIASVSTVDAVETLENKSKGYVRVLVLDPREPQTAPYFIRSLQSCLSLRFPTNAAGDPYLSSSTPLSSRPHIHSLISLLSLFPAPSPMPLESLSLTDSYLPHLLRTHITPLRIVQSLLPVLRRSSRFPGEGKTRKSIIICVPAIGARVGVAFAGEEAMSTAATTKAIEVLRRELNACASPDITAPKVVLVDVGAIALSRHRYTAPTYDSAALIQGWTVSERAAYGAALQGAVEHAHTAPRAPAHVHVFVDALVGVVSSGARGKGYGYGYKSEWSYGTVWRWILGRWGRIRTWIRGNRFSVGAGVTYSLASYLPPVFLDFLLNIPYNITWLRNSLLPVPPSIPSVPPAPYAVPRSQRLIEDTKSLLTPTPRETEGESSDAVSEPDADSASVSAHSEAGPMGESWVSLKDSIGSGLESGMESGKE